MYTATTLKPNLNHQNNDKYIYFRTNKTQITYPREFNSIDNTSLII